MKDPIPAPASLIQTFKPLSHYLGLTTLPLHAHEVLGSLAIYEVLHLVVSPAISRALIPKQYAAFSKKTKINWDSRVTSQIQQVFILTLVLVTMLGDKERANTTWQSRLWGYNGIVGLIQGSATGYFLWDVHLSAQYIDIMGADSLAHAVGWLIITLIGFVSLFPCNGAEASSKSVAMAISSPGSTKRSWITVLTRKQRPFANYYGPNFMLYELSTPFLNNHWFFDKLGMTGSTAQLVNGVALLLSFALSRLVWGTYQCSLMFADIYEAWKWSPASGDKCRTMNISGIEFPVGCRVLPTWLALAYVGGNTLLTVLNFWWFKKMIAALRKRFDGPKGEKDGAAKGKVDGTAKKGKKDS